MTTDIEPRRPDDETPRDADGRTVAVSVWGTMQ